MEVTPQQIQNLTHELIRSNLLIAELIAHLKDNGQLSNALADKLLNEAEAANKRLRFLTRARSQT